MEKIILTLLCAILILHSCHEHYYSTILVGDYEWMSTNLANNRFQNGDVIEYAQSKAQWHDACENMRSAYCVVNDSMNSDGYLYNFWAIKDKRNIAPRGWRITTSADWEYAKSIDSMKLDMVYDVYAENKLGIGKYWHRSWPQPEDSVDYFCQSCFWTVCDSLVEYVYFFDANSISESYNADEGIGVASFESDYEDGLLLDEAIYVGHYVRCVKE